MKEHGIAGRSARSRLGAFAVGLLGLASLLAWLVVTPGAGAAEHRAAATKFTIGVATTPLGKVVVDSSGHSLYLFEADRRGRSACYGACAKAWPPVIVIGKPKAGPGARAALLGVLKRKDARTSRNCSAAWPSGDSRRI